MFKEEKDLNDGFLCPENETQKSYTPYYHENIASIINQSVILISDDAYINCISESKKNQKMTLDEQLAKSLSKVFFNQKQFFNKVSFNLFDGILNSLGELVNEDGSPNF